MLICLCGCVCVYLRKKKMKREEIIEFVVHREEREEKKVGVCRKPIDPTRRVGSVFKTWWVGLGYKIFLYNRSGWV